MQLLIILSGLGAEPCNLHIVDFPRTLVQSTYVFLCQLIKIY
jgi:hypothetical protein